MVPGWRAIIIGFAFAAVTNLATGPGEVHARPAGETGGRQPGSRIASAATGDHTCVVKEDGTVQCWGSNASGQLGNGASGIGEFETSPVQVSGLTDAVAVAAGNSHTCALRANSTVMCWGSNGSGRLGDGTTTARPTPVAVLNPDTTTLTGVVAITAGVTHTCAARLDGTARCWGSNTNGRLGNGATNSSAFASTVTNLPDAVAIAAGSSHTCAVRIGGGVRCWGANFSGQLGTGATDNANHPTPADVANLVEIIAVAAGQSHTCGLRTNGQVRCWGNNGFGQIGDGTTISPRAPATVAGVGGVIAIALGSNHSCARRADGDIRCWGRNDEGQLGDLGSNLQQPNAVTVVSRRTCNLTSCTFTPLTGADGIAGGERHGCSLQADERVLCWGDNGVGQLGTGDTSGQTFFAPSVTGLAGSIGARFISAGTSQTCARRADGTVACWGSDLVPAAVAGMTSTLSVATGASHKCALGSDGLVRCVGSNAQGQIGNGAGGPGAPDVTNAAQGVVSNLTDAAAVVSGNNFSCALRSTGSVRCWGANAFGQLGDAAAGGFSANRIETTPVTVQGLTDVIAIAAGKEHACAVQLGGNVFCWGRNVFGQVGAPAASTLLTAPFQVNITNAVAVTAGPDHTCAIRLNGGARCWGKNDVGQLGNGQVVFDDFFGAAPNPTPQDVGNLTDAVALTAGGSPGPPAGTAPVRSRDFTCVRRAGGIVRCWGDNASGQLGDNSTSDQTGPNTTVVRRSSVNPSFVINLTGVTAVTAGDLFGCALPGSGVPFCWGNGSLIARGVSSFAFNIDRAVSLLGADRVARVTILANCPEGQQVQVNASLTQGEVVGHGNTVGACTGALERYEMTLPAHGSARFEPGDAVVEAEAIVRDRGVVLDEHEWTRAVQLTR
jgi:alpha-tubulin suppressor-like RCC1 family protein